jgi:hypothetical protein
VNPRLRYPEIRSAKLLPLSHAKTPPSTQNVQRLPVPAPVSSEKSLSSATRFHPATCAEIRQAFPLIPEKLFGENVQHDRSL